MFVAVPTGVNPIGIDSVAMVLGGVATDAVAVHGFLTESGVQVHFMGHLPPEK
jgi:hypothetical protein